jgi:hypothetical protein
VKLEVDDVELLAGEEWAGIRDLTLATSLSAVSVSFPAATLTCYERRCEAYRLDVAALTALADVLGEPPSAFAAHLARIAAAREQEARQAVRPDFS